MPLIDKVNIMSYDLVHGYSTVSGHHTPLYSTPQQKQSTDNAVSRMLAAGVPANKMVIGAAFYGRFFNVNTTDQNGLYQPGRFFHGISYSHLYDSVSVSNGFIQYWDETAKAPYAFNVTRQILATYDDSLSIRYKTQYAIDRGLNGIMFWQLMDDRSGNGLLQVMYQVKKGD
jgi:chitinase